MWRLPLAYADTYLSAVNPYAVPVRVSVWVLWDNGRRARVDGTIAPGLGRWALDLATTISGPRPSVLNGSVLVATDPEVPIERAVWDGVPSEGGRSQTLILPVRCL